METVMENLMSKFKSLKELNSFGNLVNFEEM